MRPAAYDFPPGRGDRALRWGGAIERLVRVGLRRLGEGRLWERGDLAARRPPVAAPGAAPLPADGDGLLLFGAVPWSYRFQRPQQLAIALQRLGHPVLYIEAFARQLLQPQHRAERVASGVTVLRVRLPGRPDPYRRPLDDDDAHALAERLAGGLRRPAAGVVLQLPFWQPLGRSLAARLRAPLVYDRIDLHTAFPGVPEEVGEWERRLLADADLVIASSRDLMPDSGTAGRPLLLPNATVANDLAFVERPPRGEVVAGYVGALGPWIDAAALAAAARALPSWRFELAGRVESGEIAALGRLPNVRLHGEIPYSRVGAFLAPLHVALVPFLDLPLTRAVDPVKLYEALAVGLPVVATDLPAIERWAEPEVYRYRGADGFVEALRRAVTEDTPVARARRRAAMSGETWEDRAAALLAALARPG